MAQPKVIADFETQLSTAIAVGATTFSLSSATDDDGVALPSGFYYFTIDNGQSNKEYVSGTLSGTSVTGVSTVSRQGVETSGAARAHRVGASVIITDFATYMQYINEAAIAGAVDATTIAKGLVELPTQAEVDAGTATGGTGAGLAVTPALLRAKKFHDYAADAGSTDAYAITLTPAPSAYATGQVFVFKANTANTGACTLNVNSLGATTIKKDVSSDLATGDILANQIVTVVYDGTNFQLVSSVSGVVSSSVSAPVVNTYTSTNTWPKPTGLKYVIVELVGGGGGGGGTTTAVNRAGGGGGSGGYSRKKILAASLGSTETVTIGALGAGGTGANNGSAGGTTSFGSHLSANGGSGGTQGADQTKASGGAGGTATGGDTNIPGRAGEDGIAANSADNYSFGGNGADSWFGWGGYGNRANGGGGDGNGSAATGYGGGGGGGSNESSTTARNGGDGVAGYCIVTEYYS